MGEQKPAHNACHDNAQPPPPRQQRQDDDGNGTRIAAPVRSQISGAGSKNQPIGECSNEHDDAMRDRWPPDTHCRSRAVVHPAQRLAKRLPRRNVWYIARNSPVVRLSAWLGPEGCDQSWPEKQQTRNRSAARSASAECCGMRPAKRERGQMRSAQACGDCLRFGSARSVDE